MSTNVKIILFALIILAFLTRFVALQHPSEAVFDEVHFFNFVRQYNERIFFFDIHPPLGKLTIAFMGWISSFDFANNQIVHIGDIYQDNVFWLRFIPALFGALLVPLVFLFVYKISRSLRAATLGGIFILLSNALLTQSRFILLDTQLVFFSILALYGFFSWKEAKRGSGQCLWLILTGISAGMAASIKLAGAASLAAVVMFFLIGWLKKKKFSFSSAFLLFKNAALVILLAGMVYAASFYFHFEVLNQPGPGNNFMAERYKVGPEAEKVPFWEKFIYLNKEAHKINLGLDASHPDESRWYQWVLAQKPIYCWSRGDARIYLAGNPLIWIGSFLAVLFSLLYLIIKRKFFFSHLNFLLIAYALNFFPYIMIERCTFIYHYFISLVISIIILAVLLDKYLPKYKAEKFSFWQYLKKEHFLVIIIIIVATLSIYISPISYGKEVSPERMQTIWQILEPFN